ncbi:MAG: SAM-dependent chlorinase/fluorinase [Rhodospirillales bacterium]
MVSMIVTFTDFGPTGPYIGQLRAALIAEAPRVPIVDLLVDAPAFNPKAASYLLAAFGARLPSGTIFLAVVDPGVGSERAGLAIEIDGSWYVGPDNGLFEHVCRRAATPPCWIRLSRREPIPYATFHARDVFAAVSARLAKGRPPPGKPVSSGLRFPDWPDDWPAIIYIDSFGNAMTGTRATSVPADAVIEVAGIRLPRHRTFADTAAGTAFWYENSSGLVEIAVNSGSAADVLNLTPGQEIAITSV